MHLTLSLRAGDAIHPVHAVELRVWLVRLIVGEGCLNPWQFLFEASLVHDILIQQLLLPDWFNYLWLHYGWWLLHPFASFNLHSKNCLQYILTTSPDALRWKYSNTVFSLKNWQIAPWSHTPFSPRVARNLAHAQTVCTRPSFSPSRLKEKLDLGTRLATDIKCHTINSDSLSTVTSLSN